MIRVIPSYVAIGDFFGATPEIEDINKQLGVTQCIIRAELPNESVSLSIFPYAEEVNLHVTTKPFRVFDYGLADVLEVEVVRTADENCLVIRFLDKNIDEMRIRVRPHLLIFWGNTGRKYDEASEDDPQPM